LLDWIFKLLASALEWFYSLVPSYGFAIIALTTCVLLVLSPLTYRSTKSMVSMRRLQPQVKRLQKKYRGDRETLNQEMMKLYQEHNVSPLSGCLPILIQSPVFIVMFRVIRGITRRSSDIGFDLGQGVALEELGVINPGSSKVWDTLRDVEGPRNFNPEYLSKDSAMYLDLVEDNEMPWFAVDLSRTPYEVFQQNIGDALPYFIMVAIVAFLGWYQQRQIQGRMTGEISSQQEMIMKIIPWMLPIFSFTMPGGLVLYFIVSALLRIAQQAYITRTVYQNEELNAPIDFDVDEFDDDDDDDDEPENPLAALFGGGGAAKTKAKPAASARHGSRRPTTDAAKERARPRATESSGAKKSAKSGKSDSAAKAKGSKGESKKGESKAKGESNNEKVSGWGRAKRSAPQKSESPEKPVSRRVTPKGDSSPNRRGKK